jgi:hypothetical protein
VVSIILAPREDPVMPNCAPASWTAPALWRFSTIGSVQAAADCRNLQPRKMVWCPFRTRPPFYLIRSGARTEHLAFCLSGPLIRAARYGTSNARKNWPALVALTFSTRTFPLVSTSGLASNVQLPIGCVMFVVL